MYRKRLPLFVTMLAVALLGIGCAPVRESEAHGPALPEMAYVVVYAAGENCVYLSPNVSPERGLSYQVNSHNFLNEGGNAAVTIPALDGKCQAPSGLAVNEEGGWILEYRPCTRLQSGKERVDMYYCPRHDKPSPSWEVTG